MFDHTNRSNNRIVIVTSYNWWTQYFGPKKYLTWLREDSLQEWKDFEDIRKLSATVKTRANPTPFPDVQSLKRHWVGNMANKWASVTADECQVGLRNPSSFWYCVHYAGDQIPLWLFSGGPARRGNIDYYSYLRLLEAPGFNKEACKGDHSIDYFGLDTNPYTLPDEHPAAKFRASSAQFYKWIIDKAGDQDETSQGQLAQKALKLFIIRRTNDSAYPLGSEYTIARSLPPAQHSIIERAFTPTMLHMYRNGARPWIRRLILMRELENAERVPTPNGRSQRALEILALFPWLGLLHIPNPPPEVQFDLAEPWNRDLHSWFFDGSDLFKKMPELDENGSRIRWLLHRAKERAGKHYAGMFKHPRGLRGGGKLPFSLPPLLILRQLDTR